MSTPNLAEQNMSSPAIVGAEKVPVEPTPQQADQRNIYKIKPTINVVTNPRARIPKGPAVDIGGDLEVAFPPQQSGDSSHTTSLGFLWLPVGIATGLLAGILGWKLYSDRNRDKDRRQDTGSERPRIDYGPCERCLHYKCPRCESRRDRLASIRTPPCDCQAHTHCRQCGGRKSLDDDHRSFTSIVSLDKLKRRQVWRPR